MTPERDISTRRRLRPVSANSMGASGRFARRPLADMIREQLANDFILSGAVQSGELLPSEGELADHYGVSRDTVRSALRSLAQEGLVDTRHGLGSVVLPRRLGVMQSLDRLCSLETFVREAGQTVESAEIEWQEIVADEMMAARLSVPIDHNVLVVRRVKLIGKARAGWLVDHLPEGILPFETLKREFSGSILDILLSRGEPAIDHADMELEPVSLPRDVAQHLDAKPGSPALLTEQTTWTSDGRVAGWARSWLLPGYFRFAVRRRRPL